MKRYRNTIIRLLCLLLVCLPLAGCRDGGAVKQPDEVTRVPDLLSNQPQSSVVALFKTPDCDLLTPVSFGINSSRDTIWIALEKLLAGPPDDFVEAVIPAGIKVKELYFAGGLVHIGLSGDEPLDLADVNLPAIWGTVNMELLEQDNTTAALQLYYNDEPMLEEPYTTEAVNDFGGGTNGARVYFSDSQATYVVPVSLPIYAEGREYSEYLAAVTAAWAGEPPADSGVYSALPDGLELIGCRFAEGVLSLDFNEGIKDIASSSQGRLLLDSLLATLARCQPVEQVRLLCGGEPLTEGLPGGMDLSQPIAVEHDLDMINRVTP